MRHARFLLLGLVAVGALMALLLLQTRTAPPASAEPTVIATIAVGSSPRLGVGVNSTTNRIYVANVDSNNVSVIDGATNTEIDADGNPANGITRIPVGAAPAQVATDPATNRIYVTNQNSNNVSVIDGATNTEIDTDGNPANGITRIPVGSGPVGVDVNPLTNRIYVGNFSWGSGSVSVIDGATNTEIDTDGNPANGITRIPVGDRPHEVAVNTLTNRIYVVNWGSDNLSVIDGATNAVAATVPVGSGPCGVGVNPSTNRIYVSNTGRLTQGNDVSVIDGTTDTEIDTDGDPANGITRILVATEPQGVAVDPTTGRIYTANRGSNSVSVIDGSTNTVVATVSAGSSSYGVAVNPSTNRIYVTNRDDNTVSVIEDLPTPTPTPCPDSDGDGWCDDGDNCPSTANTGQENNVHPGTTAGDHCEDPDADTVFDVTDNCPDTTNPGQENADGDQWGDACDNCPDTANPGQENNVHPGTPQGDHCEDPDGDGWLDIEDNCPDTATAWLVPPGDGDCDGFATDDEGIIGTDAADACADNGTDDCWPPDFDMNAVVNISDVFMVLPPYFGRTSAHPEWDARRDLVPDGVINIADVFKVLPPFFGASCTP